MKQTTKKEKLNVDEIIEALNKQHSKCVERVKDLKSGKVVEVKNDFELEKLKREAAQFTTAIENENAEALGKFLTWKRSKKLLTIAEDYKLNELEANTIKNECQCIAKTPVALHANIGEVYKYNKYYDESREQDVYITYITRTIEPEEQISKQLASKIARGFHPEPEDYEPAKTVYHRRALVEKEWLKYFKAF